MHISTVIFILTAILTVGPEKSIQDETEENRALELSDIPDYEMLGIPLIPMERSKTKKKKQKQDQTQNQESGPCTCKRGTCTCCSGPILDFFQQKACMRVVYIPDDFAFDLTLLLNNRVMYKNVVSGKNPPPACIRIPRINSFKLCAKFSNIYFAGRNLHMCMGMQGVWNSLELFAFNFDCVRMGSNGIAIVAPEDGGGLPGGLDALIDSGDDIDDYDENVVRSVTKIKKIKSSGAIS